MNTVLSNYLGGANILGFCVIALFFLKFWRRTRDPLFRSFAIAFAIMALGRIVEGISRNQHADTLNVYLLRLLGFGIILYAMVQKNVSSTKQ